MNKYILAGGLLAASWAGASQALEVSAEGGFMSEYVFRGVPQNESAAFAGLDFSLAGFYLGSWAADVGDGLEVDLYGGYLAEIGDFEFGIGATGYFYTDDFDDTYAELNLSAAWQFLSLEAAFGKYKNFDGPREKYSFFAATVEHLGFYGTVGTFGRDFDGGYYEAGYNGNFESVGIDYSLSFIHSTSTLLGEDSDNTLVLSVGKRFQIR